MRLPPGPFSVTLPRMADRSDLDVWVLAGQSNMQGRAWLHGALSPDPRVWSFTSAGVWEQASEPLHRLWESFTPVHQDIMRPDLPPELLGKTDAELAALEARTEKRGAGLGIAFGAAMADALGRPIGLVPAAHGGTSLEHWNESEKSRGGRSLYGAMLERIRRAGGRLRGVLWYQGESDAESTADAGSYAQRFDRWIAALRRDTGAPGLPVIVVQIGRVLLGEGTGDQFPGWDTVREALATLPERTPDTAVTTAVDLSLDDTIHISTEGLIRLGRRLARLALRFSGRTDVSAGPRVKRIERWITPEGGRNGLRVLFDGVTGGWTRTDGIDGFQMHGEARGAAAPMVINARVDRDAADDSVVLVLDREPADGERLSYGQGTDPRCDLVDRADMPLCSFAPRPIGDAM